MPEEKKSVSRRDFGKKVAIGAAGVAAAAALPVGKACAFTYDANGKTHGWICCISELLPGDPKSLYEWAVCGTQHTFESEAPMDHPFGDCNHPDPLACYTQSHFDGWEKVDVDGRELRIEPGTTPEHREELLVRSQMAKRNA